MPILKRWRLKFIWFSLATCRVTWITNVAFGAVLTANDRCEVKLR